jgi:hypothetical protein
MRHLEQRTAIHVCLLRTQAAAKNRAFSGKFTAFAAHGTALASMKPRAHNCSTNDPLLDHWQCRHRLCTQVTLELRLAMAAFSFLVTA